MTAHPKNYFEALLRAAGKPLPRPELQPGELRKIEIADATGRIITTWEGSPSAWLAEFASPARRVTGINTRRSR